MKPSANIPFCGKIHKVNVVIVMEACEEAVAGSIRVRRIKPVLNKLVQVHYEPGGMRTFEKDMVQGFSYITVCTVTIILLYVHSPATQLTRRDTH